MYQETDYDYSKYLGPDWKKALASRSKKVACIVTNHVGMLDWHHFLGRIFYCTFVMRREIDDIPLMGGATRVMQCFPADRTASQEEREKLVAEIKNRMKGVENGVYARPVWIAADSVTHNGTGIIPFKRGAFESLCAVKPCVLLYDRHFGSI